MVTVGAILGAGFLIGETPDTECRITSHDMIDDDGTAKIVGMSNCQSGAVILTLDGIPFEVTVKNGLFGA